jgi:drug/metabolite transporter (DMT)-like permease
MVAVKLMALTASGAALAVCIKVLGPEFGVFQQMSIRAAVSLIVLSWAFRIRLNPSRTDITLALVRGFLMSIVSGGLYIEALGSSKTALVCFLACLPYEAFCAIVLFRERPNLQQAFGLAAGIAGLALLSGIGGGSLTGIAGCGAYFAVLSGLSWAIGISLARYHSPGMSSLQVTYLNFVSGALWCTLAAAFQGELTQLPSANESWLILGASCLSATALSWLSNDLARNTKLANISLAGLAQPILASILAYFILNETLGSQELAAATTIMVSAIIYEWNTFKALLTFNFRTRKCHVALCEN